MKIKDFLDNVIYYTSVPKCVCCYDKLDRDDRALCKSCFDKYESVKFRKCSVCFKHLDECACSNEYLEHHSVKKLVKVFRYKASLVADEKLPQNELIYNLKRKRRIDIIDFLSDELIKSIKTSLKYEDAVITNVPRKKSRVLKYGFDHAQEIAKAISKKLSIPYVSVLKSKLKNAQKKTHGQKRFDNAEFDFIRRPDSVKGRRVIIVDDIVTTGASMGKCAMLVKSLGAKEVMGVAVAIAYKDKYTPFEQTYN